MSQISTNGDSPAPHESGQSGVRIESRSGEMHVFLDQHSDDHIVTKFIQNKVGQVHEVMLPAYEWAWERAVTRAKRAIAFLSDPGSTM